MPRYIDAEVALQSFCAECNHTIKCEDCDIKYHLEEFVPAADVAEVKRGRWLITCGYPHKVYCSECYATLVPNVEWLKTYNIASNYCPNCGSKMDEEEE